MLQKKYLFLNWKTQLLKEKLPFLKENIIQLKKNYEVVFIPPPFYLSALAWDTDFTLGAPHLEISPLGQATGSLSLSLLKDFPSVRYVLVGHAELRQRVESSWNDIELLEHCLEAGLKPIYCIGENDEENLSDLFYKLEALKNFDPKDYLLAYEPVWAIGSNQRPTLQSIENTVALFRRYFQLPDLTVLYGGSVDEHCFDSYLASPFLSGLLLGRMSHQLSNICQLTKEYI